MIFVNVIEKFAPVIDMTVCYTVGLQVMTGPVHKLNSVDVTKIAEII